jgi:hypothetical protein
MKYSEMYVAVHRQHKTPTVNRIKSFTLLWPLHNISVIFNYPDSIVKKNFETVE